MRILMACVLIFSLNAHAQRMYQGGILPILNLQKKLKSDVKLNFRLENRAIYWSDGQNLLGAEELTYNLSDAEFTISKKIRPHISGTLGYRIRYMEDAWIHRTLQQVFFWHSIHHIRVVHRLGMDQNFRSNSALLHRYRYRISAEFPLSGHEVNAGEFYYKLGHEYVQLFQNKAYSLEARVVQNLGYEVQKKLKLELGLDYRLDQFTRGFRHRYWWTLGVFKTI